MASNSLARESSIYIDLDAILDTRLATIYSYGYEKLLAVLEDEYDLRLADDFVGIDRDDFVKRYAARDKKTLKDATVTRVAVLIQEITKGLVTSTIASPYVIKPSLVVNCYPYTLNEAEMDAIAKGIYAVTKGMLAIQMVNKSPEELPPSVVKDSFSTMIVYDYAQWLNTHIKNNSLGETPCPTVGLIAPMLCFTNESVARAKQLDVFNLLEANYSPFIKLMFYPVEHFSMDTDRLITRLREKAKEEQAPQGN